MSKGGDWYCVINRVHHFTSPRPSTSNSDWPITSCHCLSRRKWLSDCFDVGPLSCCCCCCWIQFYAASSGRNPAADFVLCLAQGSVLS
jgi:hypothetical protein